MDHIRKIGNDNEIDKLLNRVFTFSERIGYVEVGKDNFCLPVYYEQNEEVVNNFEIYDDDVFVCGHPKTGTTWCGEMVWLMVNNLNYEEAYKQPIYKRIPQLELAFLFNTEVYLKDLHTSLKDIGKAKQPRCIKTHLHWSLLPKQIQNGTKKPKMIITLRNSQDSCVSLYHHSQMIDHYLGTFEEFCTLFLAGRVCFGPFWKQVLSYWEQKERENLLFITFEEMRNDLPAVIRKVSTFLGKTYTEEEMKKLTEHLSFQSMKKNPATNHEEIFEENRRTGIATSNNPFIRSGQVGAYKSRMSPDMVKQFEEWNRENLVETGLILE
ncbi:hypothetical protein ILUMI_22687 [Ignelater luminosus]|uniref:Sulfotransferase domain-containing protein n=1 Tax=Ignelater luminosus TaxID=2038154 RepID=A0A8K0G2L5_IGNLU|nr:hypothetical protein ILUMI_22687 [Ignelater luminosus]